MTVIAVDFPSIRVKWRCGNGKLDIPVKVVMLDEMAGLSCAAMLNGLAGTGDQYHSESLAGVDEQKRYCSSVEGNLNR